MCNVYFSSLQETPNGIFVVLQRQEITGAARGELAVIVSAGERGCHVKEVDECRERDMPPAGHLTRATGNITKERG
jgi:hypothetical protein